MLLSIILLHYNLILYGNVSIIPIIEKQLKEREYMFWKETRKKLN